MVVDAESAHVNRTQFMIATSFCMTNRLFRTFTDPAPALSAKGDPVSTKVEPVRKLRGFKNHIGNGFAGL